MARLTTFLKEQELPRILRMTLEFDKCSGRRAGAGPEEGRKEGGMRRSP
ncbi:hypothetical protein LCGC14_2191510 [marine sediment metagenome]|uniref:Uncharacterized protein n=1 Tax=marine sediment metagenome TaxID=412755 RepID=A0A0F9GFA4_9ZZZZ